MTTSTGPTITNRREVTLRDDAAICTLTEFDDHRYLLSVRAAHTQWQLHFDADHRAQLLSLLTGEGRGRK